MLVVFQLPRKNQSINLVVSTSLFTIAPQRSFVWEISAFDSLFDIVFCSKKIVWYFEILSISVFCLKNICHKSVRLRFPGTMLKDHFWQNCTLLLYLSVPLFHFLISLFQSYYSVNGVWVKFKKFPTIHQVKVAVIEIWVQVSLCILKFYI